MKKLVILLTLALIGSLLVFYGGQLARASHPAGAVAYWPFDDSTADDAADHSNHGTLVLGASFSSSVPPTPSNVKSLSLDGIDDLVTIPDSATLDLAGSLSVSAWVNLDANPLENNIVSKDIAASAFSNYNLHVFDNRVFFALKFDATATLATVTIGTAGCDPGGCFIKGASAFVDGTNPLGTWRHIAGVYDDATKTMTVYLDGAKDGEASFTTTGSPSTNGEAVQIGKRKFGSASPVDGLIDEVQIYSRAHSLDEIEILAGTSGLRFVDNDDGQVGFGTSIDCDGVGIGAYTVIQDAVDATASGDSVLLCGRTFGQSVVFGFEDSGITLGAVEGASPVLDGTGLADSGATIDPNAGIKLLDGVIDVEIISLELTGFSGSRGSGISAWDVLTSNIRIRDNDIHGNAWNGVLVGSEGGFVHSSWMVRDNLVEDNGFVGIELTNCDSCTIIKNTVTHNGFADIVVQARNTVAESGLVAIDGVSVLHNTVGSSLIGIYVLSFTGHPTAFTPISGASTLLTSVNVQHNTVTDSTVSQIRFWAFNDAATAENGRISHNEINCPSSGSAASIQILVSGSGGEEGTVSNVKVVGNSFDAECPSDIADEGENTKIKP